MRLTTLVTTLALAFATVHAGDGARIATTPNDFIQPGTQPSPTEFDDFIPAAPLCSQCHGGYAASDAEPYDAWAASMMAQAARDPMMRAAAAIANDDAAGAGETCIRCHAPIGWLGGRSTAGDLDMLTADDRDGVTCHVCHRMLDPIARPDAPASDAAITAALANSGSRPDGTCAGAPGQACTTDAACAAAGPCRVRAGQGRYVIDPDDARRGPTTVGFHLHQTTASPFHRRADACAPCHDVSTPTYTRAGDGTYVLNALDAPHPTQNPDAMFPEQRTYSEWRASTFAVDGVIFADGRFGGALTATLPNTVPVGPCQDCHMPAVHVAPCQQSSPRPTVGGHWFTGANSWVLGAVLAEYGPASGLTADAVTRATDRTHDMLAKAADVTVTQAGYTLTVRVTNHTGHKLPTGYPEGRRMWLGVRYYTGDDTTPIAEDGAYDPDTATLDLAHTTRIYEVHQVLDAAVGQTAGLPVGTPFHLALSNVVAADNRIPPRGFTNAAFAAFGGGPVGVTYADGQHWDDVTYRIPTAATRVEVSLYYQTTTREYAEFLRDTTPDGTGPNAYARWVVGGKSAPVVMNRTTRTLEPICMPDAAGCDDGDPCTHAEVCVAGACGGGTPVVCCAPDVMEFAALDCVHAGLVEPTVCTAPLPRTLRRALTTRIMKATQVARAAARRRTRGNVAGLARALRALTKVYDAIGRTVAAAVTHPKPSRRITAPCAATLEALIARARTVVALLATPPA